MSNDEVEKTFRATGARAVVVDRVTAEPRLRLGHRSLSRTQAEKGNLFFFFFFLSLSFLLSHWRVLYMCVCILGGTTGPEGWQSRSL